MWVGIDVDHADLRSHDHAVVVGHPVARRAQPVAVQHGADHRPVRERHRRRPVPRLHDRAVEAVEVATGAVHRVVLLPCLGDHHQHGVGERATTEVQQLEDLVETGRVGRARCADGEDATEVPGQEVALQQRLAGPHPVAVALHGVDLAVVGDVAVRMGEGPGRERVGREPRVDQGERALDPLVGEVRVEGAQLRGGEHALVDDGAAREAREVHPVDLVLDPLADDERPALERQAGQPGVAVGAGEEHLAEARLRRLGPGAEGVVADRHVPPSEHGESLAVGHLGDRLGGRVGGRRCLRQEGDAGGVGPRRRQVGGEHLPVEPVGDLDQDPGAVPCAGLVSGGAPVLEVAQRPDRRGDDPVAPPAFHVHHERHAARVVLEGGVVEAHRAGLVAAHRHPRMRWSGRRWPVALPGYAIRRARWQRLPRRGTLSGRRWRSAVPGRGCGSGG